MYQATSDGPGVLDVRMDAVREGWEQWFLIITDAHWDNPHCNQALGHRLMKQAVERGAGILFPGDLFCAMQGKYDKRADKSSVRPEHQVGNYLDALVDTAADALRPYKDNILVVAPGNHETAILRHMETDLTGRLASALGVYRGGYAGWVNLMFSRGKSNRITHPLYYFHGAGGGSIMGQNVANMMRRLITVAGATFYVYGHTHNEVMVRTVQERMSPSGKPYLANVLSITGTTLKQDYDNAGGWQIERGGPPKPVGATWLHLHYDTHARGNVGYQILRTYD